MSIQSHTGLGLIAAAMLIGSTVPAQAQSQSQSRPDPLAEAPLAYIVRKGDTLIDLARAYLNRPADYRQLQRENRVANPRRMSTGTNLNIPTELLRTRPDPAQLESYHGQVVIQRNGQNQTLRVGMAVAEGDIVITGANAFARVAMSDGSHAVVPSNSRILIERLRRFEINDQPDHRLTVQRGRLENSVRPRQSPGTYRVTSPAAVSAVRGTSFRVAFDEDTGTGSTGVLEGRVATLGNGAEELVLNDAGNGVIVSRDGNVMASALLASPTLVDPAKLQTDSTLSFQLTAPQGAHFVRGRIGNDAGLTQPVLEGETNTNTLGFDELAEGRWFIRLTAVSPEGLEGRPHTYDFIRARNGVEGLATAEGQDQGFRTYRFGWRGVGEGEARFRFQLWRQNAAGEQDGPLMVDHPGIEESNFTLTDLPPGTYSWRVEGVRHRFGHRLAVWSDAETLTISR